MKEKMTVVVMTNNINIKIKEIVSIILANKIHARWHSSAVGSLIVISGLSSDLEGCRSSLEYSLVTKACKHLGKGLDDVSWKHLSTNTVTRSVNPENIITIIR